MPLLNCPCCGNDEFSDIKILWPGLTKAWGLSKAEVTYINRQQGVACTNCHSNLRSMTLAKAIMNCWGVYDQTLIDFLKQHAKLRILELNEAGHLSQFFTGLSHHTLAEYPEIDIQKLPYADDSFDLVIHSDTLEHVKDPPAGLREVYRVLKPGGYTCYTIPLVTGRLSRRRDKLAASYHGSPGNDEYLVYTEYGSDMWTQLMSIDFGECRLVSLEYPSSVAIVGLKYPTKGQKKRAAPLRQATQIAARLRNKSGSKAD